MFNWKKREWKYTFSMKVPLFFILLLIGLLPMQMGIRVLLSSFQQTQIDNRMIEVQNQCLILGNKMTRSGFLTAENQDLQIVADMNAMADIFNGRVVIINQDFKITNDTFDLAVGKINVTEEIIRCLQGEGSSKNYKDKHFFSVTTPIFDSTPEKNTVGALMVTSSTENMIALVERVSEKSTFFQWTLALILIMLSFGFVTLLMRPFRRLQKMLDWVSEGNLNADIMENTYKETRGISSAVDKTLTKLKTVDQSREEFVSNVSHELKTPITSIRVLADSLMSMEDVPVELYREFMTDISDEIDRESKIIDDLLSLVKMDKSATEINIEQVDINRLLKMILKRIQPIAQNRNIELFFESIREVTADVDEVKLSLAMNNLVENAVKYNVDGGWVRVILDADHKFFYVKVVDSGIGIPEEFQESIFERFYRVDKARSRETGGTGLGLAITKNVIMMHKGAIKVSGKDQEGTTFTVRIPLTYIS